MIGIVSDCPAVSSLNDSTACPDQSSGVAVSCEGVGNVESENTVSLCTPNSDPAVTSRPVEGHKTTDNGQSPATSVCTVSNTIPNSAPALGERTADASQENPLEATTDTELAASAGAADSQNLYHVKWIKFRGSQTPIVMQNQNGPCPLLAIVNVLLLQGKIKLLSGADLVASDQLMAYIADWIFDNVPKVCALQLCDTFSFKMRCVDI